MGQFVEGNSFSEDGHYKRFACSIQTLRATSSLWLTTSYTAAGSEANRSNVSSLEALSWGPAACPATTTAL